MIALGVVLPASANGATIEVRETFGQQAVTYIAADGEENEVTMSLVRDGDDWRVRVGDLGPQDLGAGCEATDTGAVCTTSERPRVDVDLGDLSDSFDGSELVEPGDNRYADPVVVDGGDGDDATSRFRPTRASTGRRTTTGSSSWTTQEASRATEAASTKAAAETT